MGKPGKYLSMVRKTLTKSELKQGEMSVTMQMIPLLRMSKHELVNGKASFPMTLMPLDNCGDPDEDHKETVTAIVSDVRRGKDRDGELRMYIGGFDALSHLPVGSEVALLLKGSVPDGINAELFLLYPDNESIMWGDKDALRHTDVEGLDNI